MSSLSSLGRAVRSPALRTALILFIIARLLLSGWALLVTALIPLPEQPDELLRPYVGAPILDDGAAGLLLGPWQRFDTMRYLALARDGYDAGNSVFPPLYPLAIRGAGGLLRALSGWPTFTSSSARGTGAVSTGGWRASSCRAWLHSPSFSGVLLPACRP